MPAHSSSIPSGPSPHSSGPAAVRRAGYNIGALMYFWRGHNFLDLDPTQRMKCKIMLNASKSLLRARNSVVRREWRRALKGLSQPACLFLLAQINSEL